MQCEIASHLFGKVCLDSAEGGRGGIRKPSKSKATAARQLLFRLEQE